MKIKPIFDPLFHRIIRQKGTGESFELIRADLVQLNQKQINKVMEICNEPAIFHQVIIEKPVSVSFKYKDALNMIKSAQDGWKSGTHYSFFLLEKSGIPTGALEIKSGNLERAEVGYWNSRKNPGLMTGALGEICRSAFEAGFRSLFAITEADNQASIKVLKSNRFLFVSNRRTSMRNLQEYEVILRK